MANLSRNETAQDILNGVAVEVGLGASNSPFSDTNPIYGQLIRLLNVAGRELIELYPWQEMIRNFDMTTAEGDTGDYELPDDFAYMINQTNWNRTQRLPMGGPLSNQQWEFLKGRKMAQNTIYLQFMQQNNKFKVFPQPPPVGFNLNFDYMSRGWVIPASEPTEFADKVVAGGDLVLYEPILVSRFLKLRFLQAKGFDATKAMDDFAQSFDARTGHDKGAPMLNLNGVPSPLRYLNYYNLPDTHYGAPGF